MTSKNDADETNGQSTSDEAQEKRDTEKGAASKRRQRAKVEEHGMPEAKYLDELFQEFVVLARPLAIFSRPSGEMDVVNSVEGMIALTAHTGSHPEQSPLTFRVPSEVERYARLSIIERQYRVELGTHLEHHTATKVKQSRGKGDSADRVPLQGVDAATVMFHWLNRGRLPKWVRLDSLERTV
ncbi:hypothetical protein SAMN04489806_1657 [Paramicrobacterium humi]|uniref:Uncharacterized protein n=1 Tax=Paramicrobacterium humi TaxID=640635 RepID=A0A1H4LV76_9MICO|nr:hypothetical protein [Microbacterium humi]SEB74185.1 hypothetical protein SAMN04489806_1657 [Microbacterium humi]